MKKAFAALLRGWALTEAGILVLAIGSILFLGAAQIVLRNVAGTGWVWADAMTRHLVLVAGFLGGSLATTEGRHIAIDVLSKLVQGRSLWLVQRIIALGTIILCLILGEAGIEFVQLERQGGGLLLEGRLPVWIIDLVIPYTFFSVAIRTLIRTVSTSSTTTKAGA